MRLRTKIITGILAGCFTLADYVPAFADDTNSEQTEKGLAQRIKEVEKLVGDNPTAEAYNTLGDLYNESGNPKKAEKTFRTSLDKDKNNIYAYASLGAVLRGQKRYDEAEEMYLKGISINNELPMDEKSSLVHYNYGIALGHQKLWERAIDQFDRALKIDPKDKNAIQSRAYCIRQLRK